MDKVWMPLGLSIYMCVCSVSIYKLSNNQIVDNDNTLIVIECMKMLIPINAKKKGKIIKIFVNEGDVINEGDMILDISYI